MRSDVDRWWRTGASVVIGVLCLLGSCEPALGREKNEAVASTHEDMEPCGRVRVVDRQGRPLVGALVTLNRPTKEITVGPSNEWETDRTGTVCDAALLVPGGVLEIEAPTDVGGACGGLRRLNWTAGAPDSGKRVVLDVHGVHRSSVEGRILSPEQRPVEGARVRVTQIERSDPQRFCPIHPTVETTSDPSGDFTLRGVINGQVRLHISHPHFAETNHEVRVPGVPQNIVLTPGGTWTGKVLAPDGDVIEKCEIQFRDPGRTVIVRSWCSHDGFVLEHLPAGDGLIEVQLDFDLRLGKRVLKRKTHIAPDERRQEDIRWPAGGEIRGRVVDKAGMPIVGASVFAQPAGRSYPFDGSDRGVLVKTEHDGRFAFRSMGGGSWMVKAGQTKVLADVGATDVQIVVASTPSQPKKGE